MKTFYILIIAIFTLYVLAQDNEIQRKKEDIQVLFLQNSTYLKRLNVL